MHLLAEPLVFHDCETQPARSSPHASPLMLPDDIQGKQATQNADLVAPPFPLLLPDAAHPARCTAQLREVSQNCSTCQSLECYACTSATNERFCRGAAVAAIRRLVLRVPGALPASICTATHLLLELGPSISDKKDNNSSWLHKLSWTTASCVPKTLRVRALQERERKRLVRILIKAQTRRQEYQLGVATADPGFCGAHLKPVRRRLLGLSC